MKRMADSLALLLFPLLLSAAALLASCASGSVASPPGTFVAAPAASLPTPQEFAANWMGFSQAYFQNLTLFDLSLPGTHDTLTYDLSTGTSRSAIDDPLASEILQVFTDSPELQGFTRFIGDFMRLQAQTQVLTVTEQLDAGVRFLDFRASYEPGGQGTAHGWYGYHFVITNQPFTTYIGELRQWLDSHPTEMVVVWLSHHGDTCKPHQFPYATAGAYGELAADLERILGPKLVDPVKDGHPSSTTYAQYQAAGKQVVLYLSDHALFQVKASLDACPSGAGGGIDNRTGADVTKAAAGFSWELQQYRSWAATHADLKAKGTFGLMSGATSTPADAVKWQALLHFLGTDPNLPPAYSWRAHCRNVFDLPKNTKALMTCPPTLQQIGRMTNYYGQRTMSYAGEKGKGATPYRMPMAMYLDQVLPAGQFDTGPRPGGSPAPAGQFAYLGSMLRSTVQYNDCDRQPGRAHPEITCKDVAKLIQILVQEAPYADPADVQHGRVPDWPPYPDALPQCVRGYTAYGDSCFIDAYIGLKNSMCVGEASCQAPYDGMCSEGWAGHCHGTCPPLGVCHDDCIPDFSPEMQQNIRDGTYHTQTDPGKYYVCSVWGDWYSLVDAAGAQGVDFAFNDGRGAGDKDPFRCPAPGPCAVGYQPGTDGNCYLQAYQAYKGNNCPSHCSSDDDACSVPWTGHSHGNCVFGCHNDCVVTVTDAEEARITTGGPHTVREVAKYRVCNTAGEWHTFAEARAGRAGDLAFNTGRGSGGKDDYKCKVP